MAITRVILSATEMAFPTKRSTVGSIFWPGHHALHRADYEADQPSADDVQHQRAENLQADGGGFLLEHLSDRGPIHGCLPCLTAVAKSTKTGSRLCDT